jgi:hypothetical protein
MPKFHDYFCVKEPLITQQEQYFPKNHVPKYLVPFLKLVQYKLCLQIVLSVKAPDIQARISNPHG